MIDFSVGYLYYIEVSVFFVLFTLVFAPTGQGIIPADNDGGHAPWTSTRFPQTGIPIIPKMKRAILTTPTVGRMSLPMTCPTRLPVSGASA